MIEAAMAFFIIFLIGLIFVVMTAVLGGLGHVGGGDVDASSADFGHGDAGGDTGGDAGGDTGGDVGGHDAGGHDAGGHDVDGQGGEGIHFPRLSPLMIACAMTTFGGFGWIFLIFVPQMQLLGAIGGGIVMAIIITAAVFLGFIKAMSGVQASSVYKLSESLNTIGTVSTPISPGRIGVVEHELRGQVVSNSAKSDQELKVGDQVLITDVVGDIILVKKRTEKPETASAEGLLINYSEGSKEKEGRMDGK